MKSIIQPKKEKEKRNGVREFGFELINDKLWTEQ